jgi:hypothetical protein
MTQEPECVLCKLLDQSVLTNSAAGVVPSGDILNLNYDHRGKPWIGNIERAVRVALLDRLHPVLAVQAQDIANDGQLVMLEQPRLSSQDLRGVGISDSIVDAGLK